jgi:uncharacterized protein YbaP (TraB family)
MTPQNLSTDPELLAFLIRQLEYWRERAKRFEEMYRYYAARDQREAEERVRKK